MYHPYMQDGMWWFSLPIAIGIGAFMALLVLWSLVWKGMALWKAARLGHRGWFIALLIINTAGILDILYIYIFSKNTSTGGGASLPPHQHDKTPMVVTPDAPKSKHSDQT